MQLIIQIKDGKPYEHPILLENFQQAFPSININNLPEQFAWFERVNTPSLGVYEKNLRVEYEKVGNVYKDVWYVDQMTAEEITQKQELIKLAWQQGGGFASWQFNPVTCSFEAPVPLPDNNMYRWDETQLNWILVPESE